MNCAEEGCTQVAKWGDCDGLGWCDQHRHSVVARIEKDVILYTDQISLKRIPHSGQKDCHDCGVAPGELHLQGCDDEECPRCHQQFLGCDCEIVDDIPEG